VEGAGGDDRPIHVSVGSENTRQIVWMRPGKGGRRVPAVVEAEEFLQLSPCDLADRKPCRSKEDACLVGHGLGADFRTLPRFCSIAATTSGGSPCRDSGREASERRQSGFSGVAW